MSFISIREAHKQFLGVQDTYKVEPENYPRVGSVIKRHTIQVPEGRRDINIWNPNGESVLRFQPNSGISNLRVAGSWDRARFLVGNQQFENIYPFMDLNTFSYLDGDRAFPLLDHHGISVHVEAGPGGATLTFDEVTVENFKPEKSAEIFTIVRQYTGMDALTGSYREKTRMNFNHPVFAIYAKTSKPIKDLWITLNEFRLDAPFTWDLNENRWVCIFQPITSPLSKESTINFSRVDQAFLHVDHDHDSVDIDVWATTFQVTRLLTGMAGLAFSK